MKLPKDFGKRFLLFVPLYFLGFRIFPLGSITAIDALLWLPGIALWETALVLVYLEWFKFFALVTLRVADDESGFSAAAGLAITIMGFGPVLTIAWGARLLPDPSKPALDLPLTFATMLLSIAGGIMLRAIFRRSLERRESSHSILGYVVAVPTLLSLCALSGLFGSVLPLYALTALAFGGTIGFRIHNVRVPKPEFAMADQYTWRDVILVVTRASMGHFHLLSRDRAGKS